jgi:hypothetical protein
MNTGLSGRPGVELRFQQVGTWPAHRRYWAGRNLEVTMTGRRFQQTTSLERRIAERTAELKAQAAALPPGSQERQLMERKAAWPNWGAHERVVELPRPPGTEIAAAWPTHPKKLMLSGGRTNSGSKLASRRVETKNSITKPRRSCKRRWTKETISTGNKLLIRAGTNRQTLP